MSRAAVAARIRGARTEDAGRIGEIAHAAYARYVPRIGRAPAPMVADFAGSAAGVGTRRGAGFQRRPQGLPELLHHERLLQPRPVASRRVTPQGLTCEMRIPLEGNTLNGAGA